MFSRVSIPVSMRVLHEPPLALVVLIIVDPYSHVPRRYSLLRGAISIPEGIDRRCFDVRRTSVILDSVSGLSHADTAASHTLRTQVGRFSDLPLVFAGYRP